MVIAKIKTRRLMGNKFSIGVARILVAQVRFVATLVAVGMFAALSVAPARAAQTQAAVPQNWIPFAHDGDSNLVIPAGATLRYGAKAGTPWGCGTEIKPLAADAWVTPTVSGPIADLSLLGVPDPAGCYVKELDILQTSSAQTVTVNGVATVIPALPPPPAPPQPLSTPGSVHQVTLEDFFDVGGNSTALQIWIAATNQPANGASDTFSGTQFHLEIDGVVLTCLYGQAYTSGAFTMTCTTQAPAPAATATTAAVGTALSP